jgi:undecaprenyl pyrophosphate phosphatase UppP
VDWVIMLSIPAMLLFAVLDVVYIIAYGFAVAGFVDFLGCLLSGVAAYAAAHFGIWTFRRILSFGGYDWFAYYSWGVAILAFALYLIV